MSRPAEKIAQLEAALEKKDSEVKLLQLTCRRLEEEIQQLRSKVALFKISCLASTCTCSPKTSMQRNHMEKDGSNENHFS